MLTYIFGSIWMKVLEELPRDPWPVPADQRASRCTSTALSIAASLLGLCVPGSGARIMAFVGGPSTEGSGSVSLIHANWHKDFHNLLIWE